MMSQNLPVSYPKPGEIFPFTPMIHPKEIYIGSLYKAYFSLIPVTRVVVGNRQIHGMTLWLKSLVILCCLANAAAADQFGNFTYSNNGTSITITDYPTSAVGPVEIPPTIVGKPVTGIGASAFSGCTSLTNVTVPNGVTSIGSSAFYSCASLTSFIIPSSVTSIGSSAFSFCTGLTSISIPSSVTSIGDSAFSSCTGLTSVTIPSSVTSIGTYAFQSCTSLTAITVDVLNLYYAGVGGVLFNKSLTTLIQCPEGKSGDVTIPTSVTSIGNNSFYNCTTLANVVIPNGVTSIGNYAFRNCAGLTNISIPNSVTSIGTNAFQDCTSLTGFTIPNSISSIKDYTFYNCTNLTDLTIPSSVTNIGAYAFYGCASMTGILIPSSITSVVRAFGLKLGSPFICSI